MKRLLVISAAVAMPVLVVASTAFACTVLWNNTSTSVTPTSGKPASTVSASATGSSIPGGRTVNLHFLNFSSDSDGMDICMSNSLARPDVVIGGPTLTSSGAIPATLGVIPATAQPSNNARICFITPGYGSAPDSYASFEVLVV